MQKALSNGATFLTLNKLLRDEGLPSAQISALLTQAELQQKATPKFGRDALQMLFTSAGLEQASRMTVADQHAKRFITSGSESVADLGCGVASQSLAFANAGLDVHSVEIDKLTALIARHNLDVFEHQNTKLTHADAKDIPLTPDQAVFFDPARRTAGHKNTQRISYDSYAPALDFAFETARKHGGAIKLGPGFPHEMIPNDVEAQWVSANGSVLENVLWFGAQQRNNIKRSVLLLQGSKDNPQVHELAADEAAKDAHSRAVGQYIYEPDGAVIRARLIGDVATEVGGGMLDHNIAYITSDSYNHTHFATAFRILDEVPSKPKNLSKYLRARRIGSLEIKKRGVNVDPQTLRKSLALKGEKHATIIMTRVGNKHTTYLVERI
ncbi:MAG TPA: SAM-dependent methyltransferase [Microbacteriaceae bacterium]|nr:SAM-dependent methyltransferase [Microbacteriaceae bacterium]